jgi:hypothetical protein
MNKIMRTLPAFLVVSLLFAGTVNAQEAGEHFIEEQGGFEIYGPKGWTVVDAGLQHRTFMGPVDNHFSPNLNFSNEEYDGTIDAFIDALLDFLPQLLSNFNVIERGDFTTTGGLTGVRCTTHANMNQVAVRQRMYLFLNDNGRIMVIIATSNQSDGEKYDTLFDESVRTFKWLNSIET